LLCKKLVRPLKKAIHIKKYKIISTMAAVPQNHFWAGSACNPDYPKGVTGISDVLTIKADLGNQIPNNSWMIYMFELFIDAKYEQHIEQNTFYGVPLELDLFCIFDGKSQFTAVFNGNNQHDFNIVPEVGGSFMREILLDSPNRTIKYRLTDVKKGESELFELNSSTIKGSGKNEEERKLAKEYLVKVLNQVKFESYKHFTGIEWWNKSNTVPFPARYQVQFSMLSYTNQHPDLSGKGDPKNVNYVPYRTLMPDTDTLRKQYPISFQSLREMRGCICYDVNSGSTNTGMTYSL
jgi:hypothetical protein